jgi:tetrahydromethanopterin S-methyltransferase subunit E
MKKLLIALLALALCFSVALAEEAVIDFENGATGVFQQSGSCSVAVTGAIAHEGGKSLAVTNRSGNNWDCADLNAANAGIALGDTVTVSVWVYVDSDEEGTFVIAKSGADYGWFGNATIPGKTWTELTATFTLEDDVNIRFQNYGEN